MSHGIENRNRGLDLGALFIGVFFTVNQIRVRNISRRQTLLCSARKTQDSGCGDGKMGEERNERDYDSLIHYPDCVPLSNELGFMLSMTAIAWDAMTRHLPTATFPSAERFL